MGQFLSYVCVKVGNPRMQGLREIHLKPEVFSTQKYFAVVKRAVREFHLTPCPHKGRH